MVLHALSTALYKNLEACGLHGPKQWVYTLPQIKQLKISKLIYIKKFYYSGFNLLPVFTS